MVTTLEDGIIATIKRDFPGVRVGLSLGRDLTGQPPWTRARVRMSELFPRRRLRRLRGRLRLGASPAGPPARAARGPKRMGMPAFVWTVNDPRSIVRFARDPVVECIVTDEPEKAAQLLGLRS